MKNYFLSLLTVLIAAGVCSANPLKKEAIVSDFIRYSDSSVNDGFYHSKAIKECERLGLRLPTAKELVEDAIKRNTKMTLLSVEDFNADKIPFGFTKKDFLKIPDGGNTFFYSNKNYRPAEGDLGNYSVWTSSLTNEYNVRGAFYFNGRGGEVYADPIDNRPYWHAVRCVSEQ